MRARPNTLGGLLALGAAFAFGGTTPLVQRFGRGVGPFTTAALLYAGSALFAAVPTGAPDAPRLERRDVPLLVAVTLLGAVAAPIALAWGLQHTSGVTASLLFNLEALFTVLLARLIWRETIGGRVASALVAILAGGALLVLGGQSASIEAGWGALAVVGSTLAWAGDSVLSRALSRRSTAQVVGAKGVLGASLSFTFARARALAEPWPGASATVLLLVTGVIGYGLSLRLYLHAQRAFGAARTGTVFAAAPFIGAAVAWAMGQRAGGIATLAGTALCAVGVVLQLTETIEESRR
ncbi:MAG TPA: DMT family transporter [Polyangiaceae bacterium]|nr:DMT family transporter [Polyangiaceae bacterium]